MEKLAKAEEDLSVAQADADIARAEVESAKDSLGRAEEEARSAKESASRAVEDFRATDQYREEMLESGFASYRVGYEDGRDAVQALYPELDLSGIVPSGAEDQVTEEMADLSSGGITVVGEAVQKQVAEGETAATRVPTPTASSPPTDDPASTVDPTPIMVDTPVIPDLPSVEEIDSEG